MKQNNTTTLQFGRKRAVPKQQKTADRSADLALICGVITVGVFFFGSLTGGSLTEDGKRAEAALDRDAVPVMSTVTEADGEGDAAETDSVKEFIRKSIRDTSAEPFGYMDGRWNFWEYLGDVMADLLMGG